MANEINKITVGSETYTLQDERVDSLVTGVSSVNNKTGAVSLEASDVGALSLDGGTINTSKTIKMNASTNANGANLKWGTVNSKNPYIGYASDQTDGTFVIGSLLGTNYASGLAIGGGSGNLLWKGTKVATTSDIPPVPTVNNGTLTIQKNGTKVATFTANASSNATANITVPTKVSELTNDSGFKTTDNNTTYSLSKSGSTITLTGSDGSKTSVTDANSTYSVPVNATTSAVAPSACTSNGFYYVTSSTNSLTDKDGNPFLQYHKSNNDFRILATAYSASWVQQIATDFRSEHVYIRRCENGTWQPWKSIPDYGAESITGLYVAGGETSATVVDSAGITCSIGEIEIEMSGDSYNYCSGQFEVPIVAGDGISITKSGNKAEISWPLEDRIRAGTGSNSVSIGASGCSATGYYAVALCNSDADGSRSFSANTATASGDYSAAFGYSSKANGTRAFVGGLQNVANNYQTVFGRFATDSAGPTSASDTTGDVFKVGKGTGTSSRSNSMRVTTAGKVYGQSAFGSSGADYAEMWEWADGNPNNEDRRGKFVTVDENNKIRIATAGDEYILGIISATPCVVGDIQSEVWHEMYLKDVFGENLVETVEVEETKDENTGKVIPAHTEKRWILNPEYDPTRPYVSRDERKEWAAVGLMGKLVVIDDGTCVAGRYCKLAGNGTATTSTDKNDWRVLKRMDSTHVQILYR